MRPVVFAETTASDVAAGSGVGAVTGSAAVPWLGSSVLRTRAARVGAAPRIVTFSRQRARYLRVTLEPATLAGARVAIRALSVIDGSAPNVDLALRKQVTASSTAPARSTADNSVTPASVVDGNPGTRWSPSPRDSRPWVRLDLGDSVSFDQVCVVLEASDKADPAIRIAISDDCERWIEPDAADDPLSALRIDLGAAVPPCPADCGPVHIQTDPVTWQVYAVNHTAARVVGASLSARIFEPFGTQLNHIEQRDVIIEPLSVAAGFVVSRPAYLPPTHLVSLQLHDADGALLCEHNCWRYRAAPPHGTARIRTL